jgi:hypothetical protein
MTVFDVTIDSAFADGDPTTFTVGAVAHKQLQRQLGTSDPTAQQIASFYAAEFCDSGTVLVRSRDRTQRAIVARRSVA